VSDPRHEHRVLVLAPTERDAALSLSLLEGAGVTAVACPNLDTLCRGLEAGAGAAVLTEEAILADRTNCLATAVHNQPPWSDLPLIVLMGGGTDSHAAGLAMETLGNVTLLDRPVRVATLVCAVRAALRSRRKQYEVRDYLAERARIAAELRDADARKNEFIAMLAHELRNPLAPVRNALAVFRTRSDDPDADRLGAMMERQVSHLVRLVDDLLDVSRVTRGKVELRCERVDLAAVAARAAEGARGFLAERQHRLEVELPPAPVWIEADADRIEQVVDNLLSNAGKYTEPGGWVRLSVRGDGRDAVVRVRDNGIGLRQEAIPRLFDLFMQSDRLPGRVSEGLGLGLGLVKMLVEMHGGTVSASSPGPGKGSEFTVRLPAAAAPASVEDAPEPDPPADEPRAAHALRVLVCDDNEDGAESMATLLGLLGYQVRVCHDGPAALAAAREFDPDVCLLDIGLPKGMDGYEVARRLRRDSRAGLFLAALTGYGQDEDRRRSAEAGFQAHLVKPVDPKTLSELLRGAAERGRSS
jgi:signal transduction histidine kinase/CheY-like chemotaxis protein